MFSSMHRAAPAAPANRLLATLSAVLLLALSVISITAQADPPARVARIGYVSGPVSFSPGGEDVWIAAVLNRPLVTGDQLWSDAGARIELQLGLAAIRLDSNTSLSLLNLDDRIAQFQLTEGTVRLRVRRLAADEVIEVDTPNLAYVIRKPGQYRITVDAGSGSTMVWTSNGQAQAFGDGTSYLVDAGRAYRFYGTDLGDFEQMNPPANDDFDRWSQLRDRRDDNSVSSRFVALDVIGYQDLDANGSWRNVPEYGYVWTPSRVRADWAPYRDGHWSWIEPWGWTWVDEAAWGFAVSHYGRWASINGRWGWIPGPPSTQAVYAPALVAFIGGGDFDRLGNAGRPNRQASVSWFPLGPRDVYRPGYAVSQKYFTSINVSNTVINNTNITIAYNERAQPRASGARNERDGRDARGAAGPGRNRSQQQGQDRNSAYANQHVPGAVISVPTAAFIQAKPVARVALKLPPESLAAAPVIDMAAVAPVFTSLQGAAPQGRRPPAAAQSRRVVARSAPPPPPVAFGNREKLYAANPGKPADPPALAAVKPARPVAPPRVDVLDAARVKNPVAAPPAQPDGAAPRAGRARDRSAPTRPGSPGTPPSPATAPAPLPAPPVAAPPPAAAPSRPAVVPAAPRDTPAGSPRGRAATPPPVDAAPPAPAAPPSRPPVKPADSAPVPPLAPTAGGRAARPAAAERDKGPDRGRDGRNDTQAPPASLPPASTPRTPPPVIATPPRAAPSAAPSAPAPVPVEAPRPRVNPPAVAKPAPPVAPPAAPPPAATAQPSALPVPPVPPVPKANAKEKRPNDVPAQAERKSDRNDARKAANKDAKKDDNKDGKEDRKDNETDKERKEKKPN